jgi:uncharacterized membrane protein
METTFKERISNVISWAGFLWLVSLSFFGITAVFVNAADKGLERGLDTILEFTMYYVMAAITGWIVVGIVNYLLCGNLRLLPWEEKEGN